MATTSDLSVRQHERHACDAPVRIAVATECGGAVRLSRSAAGEAAAARVVDCSRGGVGLQSTVFFPVTCRLLLSLAVPGGAAPLEFSVRVQRTTMTDRKPTYYVGTAFEGSSREDQERIARVLASLGAGGAGEATLA